MSDAEPAQRRGADLLPPGVKGREALQRVAAYRLGISATGVQRLAYRERGPAAG
jgi:hypothetical protein